MAKMKSSLTNKVEVTPVEKKTRQGNSKRTCLAASSRNSAKKRYRGQGK